MRAKSWIAGFCALSAACIAAAGITVHWIDPYFHYHAPYTDTFYYKISHERNQNDGILKHFDYTAVITGTSMVKNFKTSEADALFGTQTIKVPYAAGSYKETHDAQALALETHPEVSVIVCGLGMYRFFDSADTMLYDPDQYPTYLYNDNPLDDVEYFLNRTVLEERCGSMILGALRGDEPGITSFDDYDNFMDEYTFGPEAIFEDAGITSFSEPEEILHLTEEEKTTICGNITQNVTSLAEEYPDVTFYYFIPPYSAVWWGERYQEGTVCKYIEAEQYIIELILPYENIHLFSWNDKFELTTNLNNYMNRTHYGEWVNHWMLEQMASDTGRLTEDNYLAYLDRERDFYSTYDYNSLFSQEDLDDEQYAAEAAEIYS